MLHTDHTTAILDRPVVKYKDVFMPLARWTDASDLALVRDWFYPQHVKISPVASQFLSSSISIFESRSGQKLTSQKRRIRDFDPYAPNVDPDMVASNTAEEEEEEEKDRDDDGDEAKRIPSRSFNTDESIRRRTKSGNSGSSQINRNRRRAIERIEVYKWHDRKVPHAILATADLIDAQLHYEENYQHTEDAEDQDKMKHRERAAVSGMRSISEGAMKSIFAMAFCRFVNGFVDRDIARSQKAMRESGLKSVITNTKAMTASEAMLSSTSNNIKIDEGDTTHVPRQAVNKIDDDGDDDRSSSDTETDATTNKGQTFRKGAGESSMYKNASTIGMPASFVDLRHRATHGREPPRLAELKRMVDEALKWLWENWWKVNVQSGDAVLRDWEIKEWDRVLTEFVVEMNEQQQQQQEQVEGERQNQSQEEQEEEEKEIDKNSDPQLLNADKHQQRKVNQWKWESITENGITRFERVTIK